MLKRLAILGLLGLAILPPSYPQEGSDHKQPKTQENKSPSVTVIDNSTRQSKTDGPAQKPPETHAGIEWSNWALVVIGAAGVLAALITLRKIERQTKAGEDAAKAAFLNAQAVINAQRPWLLVVIKPIMGPMGGFNIHVRNRGRTPAMITTALWGCVAVKEVINLPKEPVYWPRKLVQDRIVMPDGAVKIWWFDSKTLHNALKDQFPRFSWEGRVFVFGTIFYRDLADPSPTALHETRWIGLYQSGVEELGDSIFRIEGIGVADEYHRYT
jgi:hypothetical protein